MDFLSQLGPNKVIIPINTNHFEETVSNNDELNEINQFDNIEDLSSLFRSLKRYPFDGLNGITKEVTKELDTKIKQVKKDSTTNVKDYAKTKKYDKFNEYNEFQNYTQIDYLIKAFLENIDGTITLLPPSTRKEKIEKFKSDLIMNVNVLRPKRSGLTKDDIIKMFDNNDFAVCNVISNLFKKTIVIDRQVYGTYDTCIILKKNGDEYIVESNLPTNDSLSREDVVKHIENDYANDYIKQSILEKLNTVLLSELRTIASNIGIPLYKIEEGKKRNYLKQELKDLINTKLESYKQ